MSLERALLEAEVLVVTGAGGVGKTSVSAALGLAAAQRGRRVVVCTIDPARRLASALGLGDGLHHDTVRVDLDAPGELWASMLDMKTAWDAMVDSYAPEPEVAERLKRNRIYAGISSHFVGSQGYMAMERLADLHDSGKFDLVIIDTPPTRSALDFIDAPSRMTDFLGGQFLRIMAKPYTSAGKLGLKAFNFTAGPFLKIADRVLGSQLLEDLSAFVIDFQALYEAFKARAAEVLKLMRSDVTQFVIVTTLEGPPRREARYFVDRLKGEGISLTAIVANRVFDPKFADADIPSDSSDPAAAEIADVLRDVSALATRDRDRAREMSESTGVEVISVPRMTQDVGDIASLTMLASLVGGEPNR